MLFGHEGGYGFNEDQRSDPCCGRRLAACGHCHALVDVTDGPRVCPECAHVAGVPRLRCWCPRCRLGAVPGRTESPLDGLAEIDAGD